MENQTVEIKASELTQEKLIELISKDYEKIMLENYSKKALEVPNVKVCFYKAVALVVENVKIENVVSDMDDENIESFVEDLGTRAAFLMALAQISTSKLRLLLSMAAITGR